MGIRVQPLEIEIPEDDPFKNDLLGRKEPAEVLTHLVGSIEGPCALAVDAPWGAGKTTFIKLWSQYLRNEGFPVVEFNAWENDYSGAPFVVLSSELTQGLRKHADNTLSAKIEDIERVAKTVLQWIVPGIQIATTGIPMGQTFVSYAEMLLTNYDKAQESVGKFRQKLQEMADALSKSKGGRPLIVMIDELDRCRPSYAVELLEIAKHLFAVDHIVFVLAINRSELTHSIKALYGNDFDAMDYLRRFFDIDFRLSEPDRNAFINGLLDSIQLNNYFKRTKDDRAQHYARNIRDLLKGFFGTSELSLRRVAQAIHRLGLVFASLQQDQQSSVIAVVALILRTINEALYHQFINGDASDLDVVKNAFNSPERKALQETNTGCLFEAIIIAAAKEISRQHGGELSSSKTPMPLLQKYNDTNEIRATENMSSDPEQKRWNKVVRIADTLLESTFQDDIGFMYSVNRIELLSASFNDSLPK